MLHSKKSQSILQWFNALTTKGDVNSLEQFTDGSYFYEIVASLQPFLVQGSEISNLAVEQVIFTETSIACNEEVITTVEEAARKKIETCISESVNADPFVIKESDHTDTPKKYEVIRKFIDDFYHVESSSLIEYGECQKGKELELAKVAVFLLSAMVQNLLSSEDKVVYNTTLLDAEVQANIFECLDFLLGEKDVRENEIKKSELHKILSRAANYKGTPLRKQPSRSTSDTNDLSEVVKNVPKKRKERTIVTVYEDLQDSPLKNLLESPKIQYKAAIFRKESELAKLRSALHGEENRVMDLTLEKKNLNDELEKRKKELEFYKKELESQREALNEKEEQEKLRVEELKEKKIEIEKAKKLIESQEEEIKHLKENNEALQDKVVDLEIKLKQDTATFLIEENNCLKDKTRILEVNNEEKAELIKTLTEKIALFDNDLKKYQQMYQDIFIPDSKRELKSLNVSETISTIIYADEQTSREALEGKEQDIKIKDERIKRLRPKKEITQSNADMESLHIMVDQLCGSVESLKKERDNLKKQLEYYESVFGSKSPDIYVVKDLNSINKESNMIKSAADDVSESTFIKAEVLSPSVIEQSQYSDDDDIFDEAKSPVAKEKLAFGMQCLENIIKQLERNKYLRSDFLKELKKKCSKITDYNGLASCLRDVAIALIFPVKRSNHSSVIANLDAACIEILCKNIRELEWKYEAEVQNSTSIEALFNKNEKKLKKAIQKLENFIEKLKKENEKLKEELGIAQEKYINMEKLAKKKDDDVKKALIMYQRIVKLDKKEKDSKKECGADCEKIRRRCKQLNEECLDFEQETGELKRSIKSLEGMMEHLRFEIKELKKERKELQHKLWEETSALSKNTIDRDALVLHYLKKSKHEPKNKDEKDERKKSACPVVKVDAYILNSENGPSTSNSVLASRSIRSNFFQVADEDDFLNESSLAEIHNGCIPEGEVGENRLLELQRRNTLCPPHLQSSYPLEIQNMTPSERKYYNFGELKISPYNGKRDMNRKLKSECMESDSDNSDVFHSFPVKKRKISETDPLSIPASTKHYQPSNSLAKRSFKDQGNPRKSSTPLKRVAAFVKRQSATFITPSSVNRLMRLPRKGKMHKY